MGNQTSKVLAKNSSRRKARETKSNNSSNISNNSRESPRRPSSSVISQGNYDWLSQDPHSDNENMALNAAVSAAVALQQQKQKSMAQPPLPPSPTTPKFNTSRRKSISEFFARRKHSLVQLHPTIVEENMKEFDRLQRQHYLLKSTRKGNVWAPISSPKVIVEAGTGNGIWALEMATQYKDAKVLGLDLKPPAFHHGNPANLQYTQTNLSESWPMNDNSVDFIFQRNMCLNIQKDEWPKVLGEMFRVLKPGGYIELLEPDLWHHNLGPVQQAFQQFYREQCQALELDLEISNSMTGTIEEIGYEEVEKRILDIPIGEWPTEPELKQFGFINKEIQKALLKNKKSSYVPKWGITPADYDLAVSEVLDEYEEYQSFSRFNCWIAKKPMDS